ncbi:hypothetical protein [Hymenobacter sp.]|uniref:hypothetical protein n=1 Tax=Hymenobacter sp. TaxID=1898978 RepID=UPI00286A0F89|nr:hypothetical protein [Hymenobacter sp.]
MRVPDFTARNRAINDLGLTADVNADSFQLQQISRHLNSLPPVAVSFYSPTSPGYAPGRTTLLGLDTTGYPLHTQIVVEFGPNGEYIERWQLIYDALGPRQALLDYGGEALPVRWERVTDKRSGVPSYDELQLRAPAGGYVFAERDLMRDYAGGPVEKFFAALLDGPLPRPTDPEGDANWRRVGDEQVPDPTPFTLFVPLAAAQSAAADEQLRAHRQYRILGGDAAASGRDVIAYALSPTAFDPRAFRVTPATPSSQETYEPGTYELVPGAFVPGPVAPDSVALPFLAPEVRALLALGAAQLLTVPAGQTSLETTFLTYAFGNYAGDEIHVLNGALDEIRDLSGDSTLWTAGDTQSYTLFGGLYAFTVTPADPARPVHVLLRRAPQGGILYDALGQETDGAPTNKSFSDEIDNLYNVLQETVDELSLNKADLVNGKVPAGQLPSYVDDVLELLTFAALPAPGEAGKLYHVTDDPTPTANGLYRWSGTAYAKLPAGYVRPAVEVRRPDGTVTAIPPSAVPGNELVDALNQSGQSGGPGDVLVAFTRKGGDLGRVNVLGNDNTVFGFGTQLLDNGVGLSVGDNTTNRFYDVLFESSLPQSSFFCQVGHARVELFGGRLKTPAGGGYTAIGVDLVLTDVRATGVNLRGQVAQGGSTAGFVYLRGSTRVDAAVLANVNVVDQRGSAAGTFVPLTGTTPGNGLSGPLELKAGHQLRLAGPAVGYAFENQAGNLELLRNGQKVALFNDQFLQLSRGGGGVVTLGASAGNELLVNGQPVAGGGGVSTLVIDSTAALRVSRGIPVYEAVAGLEEVYETNASAGRYQLDKNTLSGTRIFGPPDQSRTQILTALQALTPAERAAGVRLYVKTVPVVPSDASTLLIRL